MRKEKTLSYTESIDAKSEDPDPDYLIYLASFNDDQL